MLLLVASSIPYIRVKGLMDSLSPDGEAEAFTDAFHDSILANMRIAAAILLVASLLLYRSRRSIVHAAFERTALAAAYLRRTARDCATAFSTKDTKNTEVLSGTAGIEHVRFDWWHAVLLLGIIAGGAALRARWLNQPVNYDESFTFITYVSRPAIVGLSDYGYLNNHLLHTLLAHMSTTMFGNAPWALRLPAFGAGCALIPLAYALARRLRDRTSGLLAAALVATNPMLMEFSACARGYSLVVACFLASALITCDLIERNDDGAWTCLAVVAAIGFFSVPVFVYPFGVVLVWILLALWRNGRLDGQAIRSMTVGTALTVSLVALGYVAPLAISGVPERWQFTAPPRSFGAFVASLADTLPAVWRDLTRGMPPLVIAAVAGGALLALRNGRRARLAMLAAAAVMCPAAAVLVQRIVAPARAWLFLLPLAFVVSAAGWASLWGDLARTRRALAAATPVVVTAVAMALMAAAFATQPATFDETNEPEERFMKQDSEQIALFLKEHLRPDDAVVAVFPLDYPIEYYVRRHQLPFSLLTRPSTTASRYIFVTNDAIGQTIEKVAAKAALDSASIAGARPLRAFTYSTLYEVQPARRPGVTRVNRRSAQVN